MIVLKEHEHDEYLDAEFSPPSKWSDDWCKVVRTTPEYAIVRHYDGHPRKNLIPNDIEVPWEYVFDQLFSLREKGLAIALEDIDGKIGKIAKGEAVLYLGEIVGMPGHCIIVNRDGRMLWGYHTDHFRAARSHEL